MSEAEQSLIAAGLHLIIESKARMPDSRALTRMIQEDRHDGTVLPPLLTLMMHQT